jgi:hypothetical protein
MAAAEAWIVIIIVASRTIPSAPILVALVIVVIVVRVIPAMFTEPSKGERNPTRRILASRTSFVTPGFIGIL